MEVLNLNRMSTSIRNHSAQIISDWASKVMMLSRARQLDRPALIDHMPALIDEIAETIRKNEELSINCASSNGNGTSEAHGSVRFQEGFDIVEVVAEYNALREVLCGFASDEDLGGRVSRIINRTIDH